MQRAITTVAARIRAGDDAARGDGSGAAGAATPPDSAMDYVEVRDAETLAARIRGARRPLRVLAAAWLGKTRLIDNVPA